MGHVAALTIQTIFKFKILKEILMKNVSNEIHCYKYNGSKASNDI